ncbi:MAG: fibronectin type III domain-containing protein [Bdellovibrionales bacterium]|nr:fibronectin type III domain-containing protein [Bdellovibrionales bacterium]
MLAIGNKALTALGLVGFLLFAAGCKEDQACVKTIEETVALQPVKGSSHLLMSVDKLDFLADSTVVWDDIELELTLAGNHTVSENIWLSFNGFKFNRKDGGRSLEGMTYTKKKNTSAGTFKLHKMYLNGAEPFHMFLARIKKNKGVLQVYVFGKKLDIASAKITFKGKSYSKCPQPSPTPGVSPTPSPTPVPVAPETSIDSMDPSKSPTNSTSISFNFSSSTEGNTFWCSLDGATAVKCTSPVSYSNLASGSHSFKVYAQSPQGLADATPASYSWKIDTSVPSASITNSSSLPTLTSSRAMSFEFTSSKANSTFKCSLDGVAATSCTSPQVYGALSEGVHVFTVNATDSLGNVGKVPASFRWTVDATAPVTTFIDIVPADSISSNTSKSFTFTADESANFECSLDHGTFTACTSPAALSGLADGSHWFEVRATDAAGNQGLAVSYSWDVDTVAPVISTGVISPSPGLTNAKNINVEFMTSEAATVSCSLDGAPATECVSPYTIRDLSEGDHNLVMTAVDAAGNASQPAPLQWTMDFTAPVISFGDILPSASRYVNSGDIQLNVNVPQGATMYASVNGAAASAAQSPIALRGLSEGAYSVAVYAVDSVGNASEPITHEFVVDTTSPVASLTAQVLENPTNADHNIFDLSANEDSSFECALDNAGFETCVSPKEISGLADGSHTFQVRAIDLAGNVGQVAQYTWAVDTKPPVTSVSGATNDDSATFTLSADEPGVSFLCALDGAALAPCAAVTSFSGLSLGSHSFLAKAVDAAGNMDAVGATYQFVTIKPIKTTITSATPGESPTNQPTMVLTFVADQANATFKCSLDGAVFTVCSSPMTYTNVSDGAHKFVVKAVDAYGNMDAVGASYSWTIDLSPPVVSNLTLTATTNSITVTWTTNEPATRQVWYGVGSSLNQATAESGDFSTSHSVKLTGLSSNTTYSIQVSGRDGVGNVYRTATKTIKTSR